MLTELPFHFKIDTPLLAGLTLWSLALYLGCFPLSEWVIDRLERGLNFVDRSRQSSTQASDRIGKGQESHKAFLASLLSIIPFLVVGGLCNWLVEISLGRSWTISMGIIACISCGVYELGRRDGQSEE